MQERILLTIAEKRMERRSRERIGAYPALQAGLIAVEGRCSKGRQKFNDMRKIQLVRICSNLDSGR